ncbi:helix-turn-helix transcriptional regulator [Pseudomonas sp. MWU16-30317]|uniref:helix-turn-helix domain-containing protein n=1 Tax=Pseudomonas sp. MWU16-30317 TaxID=2878095 RepID=UPI001CFAB710|nr:helix-turn-helix transcriptional regulator [Pseudomonas sp. MWU16-30317]
MGIQVISRDGQPEYAVVPWAEYQALLAAAGQATPALEPTAHSATASEAGHPAFTELAALREAKGLEANTLARAVGISPAYLAMIESGERDPDAAIKRSLAWELGVPGWREAS